MHDHDACDAAMTQALTEGRDGYAEYLAARCDHTHGRLTVTAPTHTKEQAHE